MLLMLAAMAPSRSASAQSTETHKLESQHQRAATVVRVMTPKLEPGKTYRAVYVLPVEGGTGTKWGDSVEEFAKLKVAEKQNVICVFPTFADLPWYADHPTDKRLQQERYLLEDVIGLVEQKYPVQKDRKGRLLAGFSKSGWGAFSLLLRHPDRFDRAAAFDAPLMMDWPSKYGSRPIFATEDNFRQYRLLSLIEKRGAKLGERPRLAIIGAGTFAHEHRAFHKQLDDAKIPHHYVDGPKRAHHWNSGWIEEAVMFLLAE